MKRLTACLMAVSFTAAAAAGAQKATIPVACDQPYALCTGASCMPIHSNADQVLCRCRVEKGGLSIGQTSCPQRLPANLKRDSNGELSMPPQLVDPKFPGQLTSSFSFVGNADPSAPPAGSDDLYSQICPGGSFASCLDALCLVEADADHAVCHCRLVSDNPGAWVRQVAGKHCGQVQELCYTGTAGGAPLGGARQGSYFLKNFLAAEPDPRQTNPPTYCPQP